jgi:hypothetical protein
VVLAVAILGPACASFSSSNDSGPRDAAVDDVAEATASSPCNELPRAPDTFTTTASGASFIAVDSAYVYWASARKIERLARDGSGSVAEVTTATIDIVKLALTDNYVVWRNSEGSVHAALKSGGASLGAMASGQARDVATAADEKVIWPHSFDVRFAQLPGTGTTVISPLDRAQKVAAKGTVAVVIDNTPTDAGAASGIWSIGTASNVADVLVVRDAAWTPTNLTTDGAYVFFTDFGARLVASVPLAPMAMPTVLAEDQDALGPIVESGDDVFWAAGGTIRAVKKSGGCVRTLATDVSREFAVDPEHVYVVQNGSTIARVPR